MFRELWLEEVTRIVKKNDSYVTESRSDGLKL